MKLRHLHPKSLIEIKDFSLIITRYEKMLRSSKLQVIRDFNLTINEGEIVAVIGASGFGKSLLASAILGIHPTNSLVSRTITYKEKQLTPTYIQRLRGNEIMLIPQLVSSLDPIMKVGKQVEAVIKQKDKQSVLDEVIKKVGLEANVMDCYPSELSGGMIRRLFIAMVLASGAQLIIADEPTAGLDSDALNDMLDQLTRLKRQNKSILLITHDLEAAIKIADKIAVFYAGETVEIIRSSAFTGSGSKLRHPYTKALWRALPKNGFKPIVGSQPLAT